MAVLSDLPLELRQAIWEECLRHDDEGEVYVFRPHCVLGSYWRMDPNPTVSLKIPAVLHLCSEARRYAEKRLRFRHSQTTCKGSGAWVSMPERSYCPEKDVFYVPARYFRALSQVLDSEATNHGDNSIPFYANITRLALEAANDSPNTDEWDILQHHMTKMPCLKKVYFVFDQSLSLGSIYEAGTRYVLVDKHVREDDEVSRMMGAFWKDLQESALHESGQHSRDARAPVGFAFTASATRMVKIGTALETSDLHNAAVLA